MRFLPVVFSSARKVIEALSLDCWVSQPSPSGLSISTFHGLWLVETATVNSVRSPTIEIVAGSTNELCEKWTEILGVARRAAAVGEGEALVARDVGRPVGRGQDGEGHLLALAVDRDRLRRIGAVGTDDFEQGRAVQVAPFRIARREERAYDCEHGQ